VHSCRFTRIAWYRSENERIGSKLVGIQCLPHLQRALVFFVLGIGLSVSFSACADRVRILRRGKKDWMVVTELATMASDESEKKKPARSI
jgi:hypothetical protein